MALPLLFPQGIGLLFIPSRMRKLKKSSAQCLGEGCSVWGRGLGGEALNLIAIRHPSPRQEKGPGLCLFPTEKRMFPTFNTYAYVLSRFSSVLLIVTPWTIEEEKLKFYLLLPLQLTLPLAKSGSHRSRSLTKWGLTLLGTGAYLTHPCPAVCNCPAPANLLNHACPCKGQASPFPS